MKYLTILILFMVLSSCKEEQLPVNNDQSKIYAWCIVPFDSLERSPQERMAMLQDLGIKKYAYDWREQHLTTMAEELQLAKQNEIQVIAVWMWLDDRWDSVDQLNKSNEKVFEIIEKTEYQGQIWVSFHPNFFGNLSDDEAIRKGVKMVAYLSQRATPLGCKIALYNHGDWFGDPENQLRIIQKLPNEALGLVYNFHHGHHQIDRFPDLLESMLPYLWYVNVNGLKKNGPKILTVGEGDYEKDMVQLLLEKGYDGDLGVLGHVEEKDVRIVLEANLKGLKKILQ